MPEVTIYTTGLCPYCYRAKHLLEQKGVAYREVDVEVTPGGREEMLKRAPGRRTVPQIFIANRHVGGCDDLFALERAGKLDALLKAD